MNDNRQASRNPTNPAQRAVVGASTVSAFSQKVVKFEEQFKKLIPTTLQRSQILTGQRVVGLLVNLFMTNDDIRECKPSSILNAAGLACTVGLEFNNSLGQSAIIPYNNSKNVNGQWIKTKEAQWQMMYRGGITLAMRSGVVASITSEVVVRQDDFEYEYGTKAFLRHKPAERYEGGVEFHRDWKSAYCLIAFKDGHQAFRVMDRQQIEDVRDKASKGFDKDSSPWVKYEEEMVRKTVTKSELKYLDLTGQASMAAGLDDQAEAGASQDQVIEWKDYSAEDVDEEKKGYVPGTGEGQKASTAPAAPPPAAKPTGTNEPPQTLWAQQEAAAAPTAADYGPFTEDAFSTEDLDWMLAQAKKGKQLNVTNRATLIGYIGRYEGPRQQLIDELRKLG